MKKYLALFLVLVMVFAMCACGGGGGSQTPAQPSGGGSSTPAQPSGGGGGGGSQPSGGGGGETPAEPVGKAPDTLIYGTSGGTGRFLAGISPSETFTGCDAIFDCIFRTDPKTKEIFSYVLEDWGWKDDTTFTMKLKDNIYFNNGDHATGEDLLFSYENHPERGSNYLNSFGLILDQCKVLDDGYTVEMKFQEPYAAFTNTIIYLVDKSWSREVGWDSMEWYDNPVGSGPYRVKEYVMDDHITFEARDDYWYKDEGPVVVKNFIIKNYADNATMVMDFEIGSIDFCEPGTTAYERYLKEGSDVYGFAQVSGGTVCYFNYGLLTNPILRDNQKLREAIRAGVDWYALGELTNGVLQVNATSMVPASSPEYINPGEVKYDPELAKQLLAEAGFKPGELTLHTYMMEAPMYHTYSEGFQFYMQQMGINCDLEFGDVSSAIAKWVDKDSGIDFGFFYAVVGSPSGNLHAGMWNAGDPNGVKWSYIDDDDFQKIFQEHVHASDPQVAIEKSKECQQMVYDRYLAVPIAEMQLVLGYKLGVLTAEQCQNYFSGSGNWQISRLGLASAWN